jgi:hypothetical protein
LFFERGSIFLPAAASRKHERLRAVCGRDLVMIVRAALTRRSDRTAILGRIPRWKTLPMPVTGPLIHDIVITGSLPAVGFAVRYSDCSTKGIFGLNRLDQGVWHWFARK